MSKATSLTRKRAVMKVTQKPETIGGERFPAAVFRGGGGLLQLQINEETYADLGEPEEITVALWPGDRQDLMETEDFPT